VLITAETWHIALSGDPLFGSLRWPEAPLARWLAVELLALLGRRPRACFDLPKPLKPAPCRLGWPAGCLCPDSCLAAALAVSGLTTRKPGPLFTACGTQALEPRLALGCRSGLACGLGGGLAHDGDSSKVLWQGRPDGPQA